MPAPRKPAEALALAGAFDKNPNRAEGRSGLAEGTPIPADAMNREPEPVQAAYAEICAWINEGFLVREYFLSLREYARLLAKSNDGTIVSPERGHLLNYQKEFGGTPKGRNYVSVPKPKKGNEFEEL